MQIERGVVGRVLLLEGHDLLGHGDDPERECHATALALIAHLLDPGLRLLLWLRVPVAVEGPHERAALLQVELLHLEGRTHVQVDRAGVNGGVRPGGLHVADHLPTLGLHDRNRVRRRRAQGDPRGGVAGPARQIAPAALAQRALLHEPPRVLLPAWAEHLGVLRRQRQLVRSRGQMRLVDLFGFVVEDRLLHGPLEELGRVAAEELVERVLTGHVHREARIAASGPAPHLAQARHRAREGHAERRVQIADVDAELERVGGHDRQQIALREALLDLASLRRRVAGAVGRDALRQVGPPGVLEALAREALDQLHTSARLQEADRPDLALDQLGQQVRGLGQRGGPTPQALVHERRVPHRDLALRSGRAVAVHELRPPLP